jgi:hypothetical protein
MPLCAVSTTPSHSFLECVQPLGYVHCVPLLSHPPVGVKPFPRRRATARGEKSLNPMILGAPPLSLENTPHARTTCVAGRNGSSAAAGASFGIWNVRSLAELKTTASELPWWIKAAPTGLM